MGCSACTEFSACTKVHFTLPYPHCGGQLCSLEWGISRYISALRQQAFFIGQCPILMEQVSNSDCPDLVSADTEISCDASPFPSSWMSSVPYIMAHLILSDRWIALTVLRKIIVIIERNRKCVCIMYVCIFFTTTTTTILLRHAPLHYVILHAGFALITPLYD